MAKIGEDGKPGAGHFRRSVFPLFEEGADTRAWASVPGELQAVLQFEANRSRQATAPNSPRVRFAHVGPLFKEGETARTSISSFGFVRPGRPRSRFRRGRPHFASG